MKRHLPDSNLSHLSSVAPPGYYEAALVGPDEDQREGWMSSKSENQYLTLDLNATANSKSPIQAPSTDERAHSRDLDWTYVYKPDLPFLAPIMAKAHLRELEKEHVENNQYINRFKPTSPDILLHIDHMMAIGGNSTRPQVPDDEPFGIRWYKPSTSSHTMAQPPPMESTDPLIIFIANATGSGDMFVTLVLNCTSVHAAQMIDTIIKCCQDATPQCKKIIAFTPPEDFTQEIVRRGGKVRDRLEDNFFPHGTCWYGPKATMGSIMGNEGWAWA